MEKHLAEERVSLAVCTQGWARDAATRKMSPGARKQMLANGSEGGDGELQYGERRAVPRRTRGVLNASGTIIPYTLAAYHTREDYSHCAVRRFQTPGVWSALRWGRGTKLERHLTV